MGMVYDMGLDKPDSPNQGIVFPQYGSTNQLSSHKPDWGNQTSSKPMSFE